MKSPLKFKIRRARCKRVLAVLNNRLETVELVREEIHQPVGDFADQPLEFALVQWHGLKIYVPLDCVVFLANLPPEPQWVQSSRAKTERERVNALRARERRSREKKRI